MPRPHARRSLARMFFSLAFFFAASVSLLGCSSSSGNFLGLAPTGHRLIPEAKALRSAYPDPLPLPRELDKHVAVPYVIEPGDVLLAQPVNLDSPVRLPGDQTVLPDGTIELGRYGLLQVAGKTLPQIEAEARLQVEAVTKDAGPITVRLVTRVSKVYYVLGEVNAPGAFPLQGRETVLDAILAAGGLNDKASRKFITLSRPTHPDGCRVVLPVCYNEIVQLGDTATNYQIAAGDRIYVPTRGHEDCGRKKVCPPCGRPQVPCPPPEGCANNHWMSGPTSWLKGTLPAPVAAPAAPIVEPQVLPAPKQQ